MQGLGASSVRPKRPVRLLLLLALIGLAGYLYLNPEGVGRLLVSAFSQGYGTPAGPVVPSELTETQIGTGDSPDAGVRVMEVALEKVAEGIAEPTDIQFPPGMADHAVVLEKGGVARWLRHTTGVHGELLEIPVLSASEQGLLGLAFHPGFADNGRFFLNYVIDAKGVHVSRVEEWRLGAAGKAPSADDLEDGEASAQRVLMEVQQPYQNHNAGQLGFGPDGYLYVGWGDGGLADDPGDHGQNPYTFLGSMLRIDVDARGEGDRPYGIPADNPFVGRDGFRPEVWAYGLRNPWRYSWDDAGRLVVADVGQNSWEEISIAQAGDNLGWRLKEGFACFADDPNDCVREDLVDPVFVYGRETGGSITGGLVYRGTAIPALRGRYVFADFVSGRLMAIDLPNDRTRRVGAATNLGKWPMLISTFGRDARGELYVGAFGRGEIYRLAPAKVSR